MLSEGFWMNCDRLLLYRGINTLERQKKQLMTTMSIPSNTTQQQEASVERLLIIAVEFVGIEKHVLYVQKLYL